MRIPLLLALLTGLFAFAAPESRAQDFESQRRGFVAYNVGFNAVMGGVGAAINKKPGQTLGNAFLKGLGKGAVGGLLIHQAKASAYLIHKHDHLAWAWPAQLTNALGSSIVQNAASNRGMLDRLHLNLWLVRADYDLKEKEFLVRMLPSAVFGVFHFQRYGQLNLKRSLQTGFLFYDITSPKLLDEGTYGRSLSTAIAAASPEPYQIEYTASEIVAHEVVHGLQYGSSVWLNAFAQPGDVALKKQFGWYKTLSRFVYLDANTLAQKPMRAFGVKDNCYLSRLSEREAHHYATRAYIGCDEVYSGFFPAIQ